MQGKTSYRMEARPRLSGTKALCERLGVSRATLWAVTRGRRAPKPALARKLRRLGLLPAETKEEVRRTKDEGGAE